VTLTQFILPVNHRVVYANVCRIVRLLSLTFIVPVFVAELFGEFLQLLRFRPSFRLSTFEQMAVDIDTR